MKSIGFLLLVSLLLVYALNISGSSSAERKGIAMSTLNGRHAPAAAERPRIDASIPAKMETATFALG